MAVIASVVVFALMTAAIVGLIVWNSMLVEQNASLTEERDDAFATMDALTAKGAHFVAAKGWSQRPHVQVLQRTGADTCFRCHRETECSTCHVNLD